MTELPDPMLPLAKIAALTSELESAAVSYCHWKSNESIDASLSGDNDLDLLVAREDALRFRSVLADLGFVQVRPAPDREILGIEDFIGLDDESGRVIHVQPHYELILGDDMTKSYRIPIEPEYLASVTTRDAGIPVPDPAFEYLVFIVRMVLKHCPAEALIARKGRLTRSELRELTDLERQVGPARASELRHSLLPFLDDETFELGRRAIERDAGLLFRAMAGRRMVRCLVGQSRHRSAVDSMLKVRARWRERRRRMIGLRRLKRPTSGGLIVAVVGGDGSGKSSLVDGLVGSLESTIDVMQAHLGKPPRSLLTRVVTRPLRSLRNRGAFPETRLPAWHVHDDFPGIVYALWHALIARDRFLLYSRMRRAAERGVVVISDRFPLDRITNMDGRRLADLPGVAGRPFARWLRDREDLYYRRIRPPDVILVLRVPPAVAVGRRKDQDREFVSLRAAEVWDADWDLSGAHVLDASRPQPEVFAEARAIVWAHL